MALKATIFKAAIDIADMNRAYYARHSLTIARHPSENDRRMMLRLLAFCVDADTALEFGRGVSTDDEPDLWSHELTGEIDLWIDLGQPDERRIRRACHRAKRVRIYSYNERVEQPWWKQNQESLSRFEHLNVVSVDDQSMQDLQSLARRNMQLQCTLQDDDIWLGDGESSTHINLNHLK